MDSTTPRTTCRYCERQRHDVTSATFMPDTCCTIVFHRDGARWIRHEDVKPSEIRLILAGLTVPSM